MYVLKLVASCKRILFVLPYANDIQKLKVMLARQNNFSASLFGRI